MAKKIRLEKILLTHDVRSGDAIKKLIANKPLVIFDHLCAVSYAQIYDDHQIDENIDIQPTVLLMERGAGGAGPGVEQANLFFDTVSQFLYHPPIVIQELTYGIVGNAIWDLIKKIYEIHQAKGPKRQRVIYIDGDKFVRYFELQSLVTPEEFIDTLSKIKAISDDPSKSAHVSFSWDRKLQAWVGEDLN